MYVGDLKNEFHEFLSGKRILLMVHYDIDSICACKILQSLFKYKHTVYTLIVVRGIEDVKVAFAENARDCKYFVFINCCGTIDIVDVLEPDEDIVFFVLDSHRPTDLCNIYSNGQIRLLWHPDDDANVPNFQDVFREDSEDEEAEDERSGDDDDEEDEEHELNPQAKRRKLTEEAIIKRRQKRQWEENRNRFLFDYSQFTYYSKASALLMFDLAWKLNLDTKELLWLAIVALTEQMLLGKIENTVYVLETGNLHSHANRLLNRSYDNNSEKSTSLKISYERDLRLVLYKHWTVEHSLKYSPHTACKLRLWSLKGDLKLHQLLADMGLPLAQCRQNYKSMDLQLRKEFQSGLQQLAEKYELDDVTYTTFTLQAGYRFKYAAADFVYALLAVLECNTNKLKEPDECFNAALECLGRNKRDMLTAGIEKFKSVAVLLFKSVQSALDMKLVVVAGPFLYYIVHDSCADWFLYSQQHVLSLLAHFLRCAYVTVSRNRRAPALPLVVSAPCDLETGTCLILGVPPLCENSPKNFFGKAFEQAAERLNIDSSCDFFDTSYFRLAIRDRARFFDALTALLS